MRSILIFLVFGLLVSCAPTTSSNVLSREISSTGTGKKSLEELTLSIKPGELWNVKATENSKNYDFSFYIQDPVLIPGGNILKDGMVAKLIVKDSKLVGSIQQTDGGSFFLGISLTEGSVIKKGSKILSAIPGVALYCEVNLTEFGYNSPSDVVYFGDLQISEGQNYDFDKNIEKGCQVKKLGAL
jgi:hypothetical protein